MYGDNFFKRTHYTVEFVPATPASPAYAAPATIKAAEAALADKRYDLQRFEGEYRAAKKAFEAALERFEREQKEVEELIRRREAAYEHFRCASSLREVPAVGEAGEVRRRKGGEGAGEGKEGKEAEASGWSGLGGLAARIPRPFSSKGGGWFGAGSGKSTSREKVVAETLESSGKESLESESSDAASTADSGR